MAKKEILKIEGREVGVTNLSKVMFPRAGFTKGEVINYYIQIAKYLLPHLKNRPITFKRFPNGVDKDFFYEKNAPSHTPAWVRTAKVKHASKTINYVLINDLPTLVWSANLANIEMHPYLFEAAAQDKPTHIVFDLDPGPGCDVFDCIELALAMREIFQQLKLECYPKVSGSKGLQLHLPLNTASDFDLTSQFAHAAAIKLEELFPGKVVSKMSKELRQGKILVDWSQNSRSKTTVAVYSMRAKREAPFISLPFTWEELKKALTSRKEEAVYFSPERAIARLKKVGDIFAPVLTKKQKLTQKHIEQIEAVSIEKPSPKAKKKEQSLLKEYDRKRDFTKTAEPKGDLAEESENPIFVIQKHQASHLHYDFRLEMQGVLKSWAVPKGPPLKSGERRLAMHVEDHPKAYATFEGTIPGGNYGGGTVMVWDYGTYTVENEKSDAAYKKGKLTVHLQGKKLQGSWTLVKDSRDPKRWLLLKGKDGKVLVSQKQLDLSARTKRSLAQIAKENDAVWDGGGEKKKQNVSPESEKKVKNVLKNLRRQKPAFVEPMKAELSKTIPQGDEWVYEVKYDGYRALIGKQGDKINIWSRNGNSFNTRYKSILGAAETVEAETFLIDGEIIAQDDAGVASFQALQNFQGNTTHHLSFYAFDILNYDGYALLGMPLEQRRLLLEKVISGSELNLSKVFSVRPEELVSQVHTVGLEGIVAKRRDSLYVPGIRSEDWIKYKTVNEQELVIGGYSKKSFSTFSSLLVGFYDKGKFFYAGKVNGGFTPELRKELLKKLKPLERKMCPFSNLPEESEGRWGNGLTAKRMSECTWVKPDLVCVVRFTEWTDNNHLRHGAFVSLRDDKKAREVGRDTS